MITRIKDGFANTNQSRTKGQTSSVGVPFNYKTDTRIDWARVPVGESFYDKITAEVWKRTHSYRFVNIWGDEYFYKKPEEGTIDQFDKTFLFVQGVASAIWIVAHNLNKFPSVTVVDTGGNEVEGEVVHIDSNNLTIIFSAPFTGRAYIN